MFSPRRCAARAVKPPAVVYQLARAYHNTHELSIFNDDSGTVTVRQPRYSTTINLTVVNDSRGQRGDPEPKGGRRDERGNVTTKGLSGNYLCVIDAYSCRERSN